MADQRPLVVVVDGHGGGMGKALVARLRERLPQVHVRAVGTNSAATEAMLKGGAEDGATGENAVIFNVGKADFVVGSVAIVMANGLMGEISPHMAQAVGERGAAPAPLPGLLCGPHRRRAGRLRRAPFYLHNRPPLVDKGGLLL